MKWRTRTAINDEKGKQTFLASVENDIIYNIAKAENVIVNDHYIDQINEECGTKNYLLWLFCTSLDNSKHASIQTKFTMHYDQLIRAKWDGKYDIAATLHSAEDKEDIEFPVENKFYFKKCPSKFYTEESSLPQVSTLHMPTIRWICNFLIERQIEKAHYGECNSDGVYFDDDSNYGGLTIECNAACRTPRKFIISVVHDPIGDQSIPIAKIHFDIELLLNGLGEVDGYRIQRVDISH